MINTNKYIIIIALLSILLSACTKPQKKIQVVAKKGYLDLSNWDFETDGSTVLDGEWLFYWNNFLVTDSSNYTKSPIILDVPDVWTGAKYNNKTIDDLGYGTYKLKVKLKNKYKKLALKLRTISTAYILYINGKKVSSVGKISKTKKGSKADYNVRMVDFENTTGYLDITIEISNYHYKKSGLWQEIDIGTEQIIQTENTKKKSIELFLIGSIFIMSLYHFSLFVLRKTDKSSLYFGMFTFSLILRVSSTSEYSLRLLYNINWSLLVRIEFISIFLTLSSFVLFMRELFPKDFSKIIVKSILVISLVYILLLILPVKEFTKYILYYQYILLITGVYGIILSIKILLKKRGNSIVFFIGYFGFILTIINDVLYANNVVNTGYLVSIGIFFFIFAQSFIISSRFAKAYKDNFKLTTKLDYQNKNLEKIVEIRTSEILQQKEEILAQSEMLKSTNSELLQINEEVIIQRDELEYQKNHIEWQNKNIKAGIRYAKTIQETILPLKSSIDEYFNSFIIYEAKDIVSGDFYWYHNLHELDKKIISVIDCTGHGVPGALMSMLGSRLLNNIIVEKEILNPSKILESLNKDVIKTLKQKHNKNTDGMDISICVFEKVENNKTKITFAGTKQSLYYYKKDDTEINVIKGDRKSIGGFLNIKNINVFTNKTIFLDKEDVLYLITVGIIDQNSPSRKRFGSARFYQMLDKIKNIDFDNQKKAIEDTISDYKKNENQRDDITIIGLKIK